MCGICGIYHKDRQQPIEEELLHRMSRSMQHRGPDAEGYHIDGNLGLGHQRLSIIDLSTSANQPMANEDGNLWIVFNGEIYNYVELRQGLLAKGHRFRSNSDVEVIIHLYEEEGQACLKRLNGMFAFAIWDARDRTLFAARDRFGIKPFYFTQNQDSFLFASEIKALLHTDLVRPELNRNALQDYLTFQFCLGEKTLFQNIDKLLPGHCLVLKPDGSLQIDKYWELDFSIDFGHDESYFEHQLLRLLEDAVRLQLRADVPLGAHLSGGLDSSAIAGLASELFGTPIKTFSGGFRDNPQYDETQYARIVARQFDSEYHEVFPSADEFVRVFERLIYHMDEPAAGPGLFPQYFVSELASQHVKVVLGGQGGDEIFGGYSRYLIAYLEECLKGGIKGGQDNSKYVVTFKSILPNLQQLQGYEPLLGYFWQKGLFESEDHRYFRLIDRSSSTRHLIHADYLPRENEYDIFESYRSIFYSANCKSLINKMTWFDMKTLLPALLQVEDRMSMAVSLESRVPLLDHRIAELVAAMPPMVKYNGGRSKHIFRQAIRHIVPAPILERTDKMGFPVPLTEWFRKGPVRDYVRDMLQGETSRSRGFIRIDQVENLLNTEQPFGRGIWGLLCLEQWMRTFLDAPLSADR